MSLPPSQTVRNIRSYTCSSASLSDNRQWPRASEGTRVAFACLCVFHVAGTKHTLIQVNASCSLHLCFLFNCYCSGILESILCLNFFLFPLPLCPVFSFLFLHCCTLPFSSSFWFQMSISIAKVSCQTVPCAVPRTGVQASPAGFDVCWGKVPHKDLLVCV